MAEPTNTTIRNPVEFLTLYQKMERLNPLAYERVCGIIEGLYMMENTRAKEADATKPAQ